MFSSLPLWTLWTSLIYWIAMRGLWNQYGQETYWKIKNQVNQQLKMFFDLDRGHTSTSFDYHILWEIVSCNTRTKHFKIIESPASYRPIWTNPLENISFGHFIKQFECMLFLLYKLWSRFFLSSNYTPNKEYNWVE